MVLTESMLLRTRFLDCPPEIIVLIIILSVVDNLQSFQYHEYFEICKVWST